MSREAEPLDVNDSQVCYNLVLFPAAVMTFTASWRRSGLFYMIQTVFNLYISDLNSK